MEPLFRLNHAVNHDTAVDTWFDTREPELAAIARTWFAYMRQCGDDVRELIHDGCPVVFVQDAAFAYVNVFKTHVELGFYHGADLDDPTGLLEGAGRRMRHVRLRPSAHSDTAALTALIDLAYADIRLRLQASVTA